jgi:hypothetical protein
MPDSSPPLTYAQDTITFALGKETNGRQHSKPLQLERVLWDTGCYDFPLPYTYATVHDSYRTFGLLTPPCLPFTPILLDGRRLLYILAYLALTRLFVLVSYVFGHVVSTFMYISALLDALETPSEFSSVPILVADELAYSLPCETRS